jgi:glycosyltransferase involved in cell wall biosynthesis
MKTVSIIILTYNSEQHIEKCLNKILDQAFYDYEVILVDGGSVDRTIKIAQRFDKKMDIRTFTARNSSMGEARNVGIKKATGFYLAFCDSDDEYLQNKLLTQVSFAKSISDKHFVIFSNHKNTNLGQKDKAYITRENTKFLQEDLTDVLKWQGCNLSSMLVTNSQTNPVYFTEGDGGRYGEDWQYNISLVDNGYNFYHCSGVYSNVIVHPGSHTTLEMQYLLHFYVAKKILSLERKLSETNYTKFVWKVILLPHLIKFIISFTFCEDKVRYKACMDELFKNAEIPFMKLIFLLIRPLLFKKLILQIFYLKRFLHTKKI